jgi:hypothetical protein
MAPGGSDRAAVHSPGIVSRSLADEAERVTCGICIDSPAALAVAGVEQRGAEVKYLSLGLVEILDPEVEMELLRASGIWPLRRLVVFDALEGEHQPGAGVKRCPAIIERPARIRLVHRAAEQRRVEPGKLSNVGAVQHHALQVGDHGSTYRLQFPANSAGNCKR